jgi:hypothetical protein
MKQTHLETIWFCAFRYCLGRSSYIVSDFAEAFAINFEEIPDKTKKLILRELQYVMRKDDGERTDNPDSLDYSLGHGCDRTSWQNVLNKLIEWESNEQSK